MSNTHRAADNAGGALDVWMRFECDDDEAPDAEANVYWDSGRYRVDWDLLAVGLVTSVHFDTYRDACAWLTAAGFVDYSA